jgi:hypothetical protein
MMNRRLNNTLFVKKKSRSRERGVMFLEVLGAAVLVSCVFVTLIKCYHRMGSTCVQWNKVALSSTGGVMVIVQEAVQRTGFWTNVTFYCCF